MYVFCSLNFVKKQFAKYVFFFVPLCCLILLFLRRSVEVWHKKSPISHRNPKKLVDGQQQKFCHGENCHLSKDCIFTRGSNSRLVSELLCLNAEHNDWDIYRHCYFWGSSRFPSKVVKPFFSCHFLLFQYPILVLQKFCVLLKI